MEDIKDNSTPFFYLGNNYGIILVHGFTGSTAEMKPLGKYLHELGYTVICPRLTGHGTSPEDMEHTTLQDWYNCVGDAYYLIKEHCENITIIGLSMGALLSLLICHNFSINKVVLLSAPINIAAERGLSLLPDKDKAKNSFILKPSRKLSFSKEKFGYNRIPLLSVHELLACINETKAILNDIKCPLLIVQSKNDHTVDWSSASYIYQNISSKQKQIIFLEKSGHIITLDCESEKLFLSIKKFLKENESR